MSFLSRLKEKAKKAYKVVKSVPAIIKQAIGTAARITSPVATSIISTGYNAADTINNNNNNRNVPGINLVERLKKSSTQPPVKGSVSSTGTVQYGPERPATLPSAKTTTGTSSDYTSDSYAQPDTVSARSFSAEPVTASVSASELGTGNTQNLISSAPSVKQQEYDGAQGNITVGANTQTGMFDTTQAEEAPQKTNQEILQERLNKLEEDRMSESELLRKSERQAGLQQARQQVQNTQNQINAVTSKMNQDILQLRGTAAKEGVVEAVYGGQQAQVTREATIKLLPLQAQLAADQGNLEIAQENTDKLYSMYSKDAERSYNRYKAQYEALYDEATASEKKQLDEISQNKERMVKNVDQIAGEARDVANSFLKDGNMAAYRAITSIQVPYNTQSETIAQDLQNYRNDVANAAAKYGVQLNSSTKIYTPAQEKTIDQINTGVSNSFNYKAVNAARGFSQGVIASLSQETGLGDISAINQFQKVIDEGAVTRDQDVKMVQSAQSLADSLKLKIKKLQKGEQLSPEQRTEMKNAVVELYNTKVGALTEDPYIKAQITKAERIGIDAGDTILGELGSFSNQQEQEQGAQGEVSDTDAYNEYLVAIGQAPVKSQTQAPLFTNGAGTFNFGGNSQTSTPMFSTTSFLK